MSSLGAGCSSDVPIWIRIPPKDGPSLRVAQRDIEAHTGRRVRWGGTIVAVHNLENATEVEVVARELDHAGRPKPDSGSDGRFIARVPGFLDPVVYAENRELTVFGSLEGKTEREIGSYRYTYPVVKVKSYHLWPVPVENTLQGTPMWMMDPWYHDPFFHHPFFYH